MNKYEKDLMVYVSKHGRVVSAYKVAKENKNVESRHHYKLALDKFEQRGFLVRRGNELVPNELYQKLLDDKHIGPLLKNNSSKIMDSFFSKKKITSGQWVSELVDSDLSKSVGPEFGMSIKRDAVNSGFIKEQDNTPPSDVVIGSHLVLTKSLSDDDKKRIEDAFSKKKK